MGTVRYVLMVALFQAPAPSTESGIDFYFTNDAVLQRGAAAAAAEWSARCVDGGEFAAVARSEAPDPRIGADERRAQAAKFDTGEFVRLATAAWRRTNAELPQKPVRVCVDLAAVADTFIRDRMGGVTGVTAGAGRIVLKIHPDADWQKALPYAVAHELHHSYWAEHHYDPAAPFTLADYLVFEGRADYLAGTLFGHGTPWTTALDDAAYATTWRAVSKELNVTQFETLRAVMFGSPKDGLPQWAGYSIGYRLVRERMARAPALDLKAMTAAPASEFMPRPDI